MDDRLHPQDWLLIIHALTQFGGNPNEIATQSQEHAWNLAERLAAEQGLTTADAIRQLDSSWPQNHTSSDLQP